MTCIHRWRLPEPDGRRWLPALCQYCGAVQDMRAGEVDPFATDFRLDKNRPMKRNPKPRKAVAS